MFIRYFVEIPRSLTELEARLLGSPADVLADLVGGAESRGERLLAEVGFGPFRAGPRKRVEVRFGTPIRFPSKTVLPLTWRPISTGGLIPDLDADIELAALGPERSQIAISARYTPPLGSLGRTLDRALLHRVAEATVKDFLDRAGERLCAMRSEADPPVPVDVGASSS